MYEEIVIFQQEKRKRKRNKIARDKKGGKKLTITIEIMNFFY
jgi:hypothetical protein